MIRKKLARPVELPVTDDNRLTMDRPCACGDPNCPVPLPCMCGSPDCTSGQGDHKIEVGHHKVG